MFSIKIPHDGVSDNVIIDGEPFLLVHEEQVNYWIHQELHRRHQEWTIKRDPAKMSWLPGEKKFFEQIYKTIDDSLKISAEAIKEFDPKILERYDWIDAITPKLNEALHAPASSMDKHMENIYNLGKDTAFKQMDVSKFFGLADKHAIFATKNYSFGLIKRINDDLRGAIKQEVWQGLVRGDSNQEIAKTILELGIQPIRSGWTGAMLSPKERSILIARTETMRGMTQGTAVAYWQYGVESYDLLTAGDDRVCDQCLDIESQNPYKISDTEHLPPIHPDCRCAIAPADKPLEEPRDVEEYPSLVEGGMVEATENAIDSPILDLISGQLPELDVPLEGTGMLHETRVDEDGIFLVNGAPSPKSIGVNNVADFIDKFATDKREWNAYFNDKGDIVVLAKGYKNNTPMDGKMLEQLVKNEKKIESVHTHPFGMKNVVFGASPLSPADVEGSIITGIKESVVNQIGNRQYMTSFEVTSKDYNNLTASSIKGTLDSQHNAMMRKANQAFRKENQEMLQKHYEKVAKDFNKNYKGNLEMRPTRGKPWYYVKGSDEVVTAKEISEAKTPRTRELMEYWLRNGMPREPVMERDVGVFYINEQRKLIDLYSNFDFKYDAFEVIEGKIVPLEKPLSPEEKLAEKYGMRYKGETWSKVDGKSYVKAYEDPIHNVTIHIPSSYDYKDVVNPEDLIKAYQNAPKTLKEATTDIELLNKPGGALGSYRGGSNLIKVGISESFNNPAEHYYLDQTLYHEMAHALDNTLKKEYDMKSYEITRFPDLKNGEWRKAVRADAKEGQGKRGYGKMCSTYGDNFYRSQKSMTEDFAEAVMSYLMDDTQKNYTSFGTLTREEWVAKFPNRAKIVEQLLNGVPEEWLFKE